MEPRALHTLDMCSTTAGFLSPLQALLPQVSSQAAQALKSLFRPAFHKPTGGPGWRAELH